MGLIARALELEGIATTLTSWNAGRTRILMPPRATFTRLKRGATLGRPGDVVQQRRILEATLALLAQDAPLAPVLLDEQDE
ncbi:MAG: hypothetical protein K8J31_25740 [Anaerolineae bacterium]|nr:hypothetical protein [Anaerolineae bacterium]